MFQLPPYMMIAVGSATVLLLAFINAPTKAYTINMSTSVERYSPTTKIVSKRYKWELDRQAMVDKSDFPIRPNKLIERCKEVVDKGIGLQNPDDLAENFQFIFPVVGPLSKKEYLDAVGGFELGKMFPGFDEGLFYDFRVDPYEPSRVWFTSNFIAVNSGDGPFGKATGKKVVCPPQSVSLTFSKDGKVIKYTGGYVMDKTIGNSGGLGGIFGPLYAIGKGLPFPEARPYSKSILFRFFSFVGNVAGKIQQITKSQ